MGSLLDLEWICSFLWSFSFDFGVLLLKITGVKEVRPKKNGKTRSLLDLEWISVTKGTSRKFTSDQWRTV